jgi:hypothetical protein
MKKILLMLLLFSVAFIYAQAQEINLGDFEDGVLSWYSWGAPVGILVNPAPDGTNSSDSVVILDQSGGAWNGLASWNENPLLEGGYEKISLDVLLNADGLIQIYMDNPVASGAATYTAQVTGITAGSWTHIEFDVSDLPANDYKQIAFQYDQADTVYFDNIVLHVEPVIYDEILTRETFGDQAWDTDNPEVQATGWPNHWDWTDVTTFTSTNGHMISGSDSSIRINSYGVSGTHPGPDPSGSMGVQMTTSPAYSGSWDTLQYVDIVITGEEGLKLGFAFGKRAGFAPESPDIRGLGVEVNIDDAGWVALDTTLIPNPLAGGTKTWVEIPIESTGDTLDVRFGDYYNQCFLDDISILSRVAQATNSFTAEKIVFGTVDDENDFSCDFNLSWDADSIYLFLDITDDSIVNTGASYQCDNIEVYYDMDNSKNIHWPRNGTWIANPDPSYDDNDWQCRLVPGVDYSVNNGSRPSLSVGVRQAYVETETGYQFTLNIALDSLMPGFNRNPGRLIGFDLLISDNDNAAAVNDANRNQITFVSPTDKPYNDCSLFSTLQLEGGGMFSLIPDTEAPSAPPDLVADTLNRKVTLTWGQSTDNIAIMSYNVYRINTLVGNVLAKESGVNTYTLNDQDEGTRLYKVDAVDNHGNVSTRSEVEVTVSPYVFIFSPTTQEINVYPNPTTNELIINGVDNITSIEVIGLSGNVIRTFKNVSTIYVDDLTDGLYILKIYTADEVFTGRFIKE